MNLPKRETTVKQLRKALPDWTWKSCRKASCLGWWYEGTKGERTVRVEDYATGSEDTHSSYGPTASTECYVEENGKRELLWDFFRNEKALQVMEGFFLPADVLAALNTDRKVSW